MTISTFHPFHNILISITFLSLYCIDHAAKHQTFLKYICNIRIQVKGFLVQSPVSTYVNTLFLNCQFLR